MAMGFALAVWDGDGSGVLGGVLGSAAGGGVAVEGLGGACVLWGLVFWSLHPVKMRTPMMRKTIKRALRLTGIPPLRKAFIRLTFYENMHGSVNPQKSQPLRSTPTGAYRLGLRLEIA